MKRGRPVSERYSEGDIIETEKYGRFEVLRVFNASRILCRSLETGYEIEKQAAHLDVGAIRDPYFPVILGVGYMGEGEYSTKSRRPTYQKWRNMLARCYDYEYQRKNPSYKGCSVASVWHNFQNFAAWMEHKGYRGQSGIHLDKDVKLEGNRVYSPEACSLIGAQENMEKAHSDSFEIESPDGQIFKGRNVSKFCREHGLSQAHISCVLKGSRSHHKGWRRAHAKP